MSPDPKGGPISTVLVDESFASQDDQFLDRLRMVSSAKYLAGLADRWKKDPRPWAREQLLQYLSLPLNRPGHHPLVKRLFKHAEASRDHELAAAFVVAFDRLVRRQRRMKFNYDFQTRQISQEEILYSPRNQMPGVRIDPKTGKAATAPKLGRILKGARLFSYKTRNYLRRRAWRYFRRLAFQKPLEYPQAVARALSHYRDADFASGENILDNWSLMHIAFGRSLVLQFSRTGVAIAADRSFGELVAAPRFEELWKDSSTAGILLNLASRAPSRLVRAWAIQLLKRLHGPSLQEVTAEQLASLLDHADQEVQQFGASLLESLPAVDGWPVTTWLRLLMTANPAVLGTICQAMERKVQPERLNLDQCVTLACARATPVARLGLAWLAGRRIVSSQDRLAITGLARVQCDAVGAEAAGFALSILGKPEGYRTDDVVVFFDSLNAVVRRGAWDWLTPQSHGYNDPTLWIRLLETPYDDVRNRLVVELNQRAGGPPALRRQDLSTVWTTVLLGVHRGGRAKLHALKQISQAMADRPEQAESLIPALAVAIRSVRPAESRAGLSAILSATSKRPELEELLAKFIPELRLTPMEATS